VVKIINFHSYGTSRDQRGGSTYPFHGSLQSCLPQIRATQPPHATRHVQTQCKSTVLARLHSFKLLCDNWHELHFQDHTWMRKFTLQGRSRKGVPLHICPSLQGTEATTYLRN